MKKTIITTMLSALFVSGTVYAQLIGSLTGYSLSTNGHDIIRDIGVTEDNSKVTVGSYQPGTNVPYDGFIWSDQTNNIYDWRVRLHGSGNDEINACDIRKAWNGTEYVEEMYVTGYFTGTATFTRITWGLPYGYVLDILTMNSPYGSNDCTYFVAKFNRVGDVVWIQYSGNSSQANTEIGNDVDVCVVGTEVQVYTTGFFRGSPYFYQGTTPTIGVSSATSWNSIFTAKYIDNGSNATLSWVRTVNDDANNQHDYGYGVCGDGSGNVFMCGSIGGTTTGIIGVPLYVQGNDDALVVKYDPTGTPDWCQDFGGNGSIQTPSDQARCITYRNDYIYVSGYHNGIGGAMYQGTTNNVDAFLFKMDADNGLYAWRNIMRSPTGTDVAYKHCHSLDGTKVFSVGTMTGDMDIHCNSSTVSGTIISPNFGYQSNAYFISFNDANGALIDYEWMGCYDNTSTATTVETYSSDKILFGGIFKDYYIYESGDNYWAANSNLTTNIYNDGFYGHYDCDNLFPIAPPVSVDEHTSALRSPMQLSAFPNPTQNTVTITKKTDEDAQIEVLDLSGRIVIEQSLMKNMQATLDLTSLEAGIYLVRVTEGANAETIRITKH